MPEGQKLRLVLAATAADAELIRIALQATPGKITVATASDLRELRRRLADAQTDVALIGVAVWESEGLEALRQLRADHPSVPLVVLASDAEEAVARAALTAGARDFVLRSELNGATMARILRHAHQQHRVDSALAIAGSRYRAVLEAATDGLLLVDEQGRIREVNRSAEVMFGYESGELQGRSVDDLVPTSRSAEHASLREAFMSDPIPRPMAAGTELRGMRADGSEFAAEIGLSPHVVDGSTQVLVSVRDLTEAESLRRMAAAVEATEDVIITIDLEGTIEAWNRAAERRFGKTEDEARGRSLRSFLAPEAIDELSEILRQLRAGAHVSAVENADRDADGRKFHLSLSFSPVRGRDGDPHAAVVIGRDITRRKLLEADLERLAYYDALTGLANRRLLRERLDYAIALARRQEQVVGVLYLDLGRFKDINDRLGHSAGDEVLVQVAERLLEQARDSDLVAREGGDEFVVLLSQVRGTEGAIEAAARIKRAVDRPMDVAGESLTIDVQLGIALFPDHGDDATELLSAADRAMYRNKAAVRAAGAAAGVPVIARGTEFERALRTAAEEDRLRLHFQPILRADDDSLAGVEALIRWEHPERGLLTASEFLSYAREMGLMPTFDRWALAEALKQVRELSPADGAPFWLSVNLSPQTLRRSEVARWVGEIVTEEGLPAGGLRLEVPASRALVSRVMRRGLECLCADGFGVTLDNFGTGDSPLAELLEVPAGCLKVDKTLIARIDDEANGMRFVRAAIELGRAAGMEVAVEGVESEGQWELLRRDECDFIQGYYLGRPAAGSEIWN